jgi:serine/threonine-protein kinase RsbT
VASLTGESLPIESQSNVETARRTVRRLADEAGLSEREIEEAVIVVSELATNLLRHAASGVITVSAIREERRNGLFVESHDRGPGIPDVDLAMRDGYSSAGGIGGGLGAVQRLSDTCSISSGPDGTRITVRKWHKNN